MTRRDTLLRFGARARRGLSRLARSALRSTPAIGSTDLAKTSEHWDARLSPTDVPYLGSTDLAKTSEHWGLEAGTWQVGRGVHWTELAAVQERINRKVSGDPRVDPYMHFISYLESQGLALPLDRCLTLGCGAGELERGLAPLGFSRRHDAFDVAAGAIATAARLAEAEGFSGIHYGVQDANELVLEAGVYDVVFGVMSVHHFTRLEHVFAEVRKALKSGGYFLLNEFVGPTKFQWTDRQLEIVRALLAVLPPKYRVTRSDGPKPIVKRSTLREMDAVDPSEAVRSAEIIAQLSKWFSVVERKDYGGSVLHLLLEGIAANFDSQESADRTMLEMLFDAEDRLMEVGDIGSDFSVIIAR